MFPCRAPSWGSATLVNRAFVNSFWEQWDASACWSCGDAELYSPLLPTPAVARLSREDQLFNGGQSMFSEHRPRRTGAPSSLKSWWGLLTNLTDVGPHRQENAGDDRSSTAGSPAPFNLLQPRIFLLKRRRPVVPSSSRRPIFLG